MGTKTALNGLEIKLSATEFHDVVVNAYRVGEFFSYDHEFEELMKERAEHQKDLLTQTMAANLKSYVESQSPYLLPPPPPLDQPLVPVTKIKDNPHMLRLLFIICVLSALACLVASKAIQFSNPQPNVNLEYTK